MRIIITGTSGFIGSRLLEMARNTYGADVTSFSSRLGEGSHITYHDAPGFGLDTKSLALVDEAEVLIHAGAFIPKSGIDSDKLAGCNANITFTNKLLSLPWNNLKKILFLSSIDVYASVDEPISEYTLTIPASLYGLSKLYCEQMLRIWASERGILCHILRIGHVYGPGEEKYAKVIPKAIKDIVAGKDVELYGNGEELRSFIFIDDVVKAILKSVKVNESYGVINVVSGNPIAIRDLLKMLILIGGRGTKIVQRDFTGHKRNLVFNNAKLKRYLLPEETDFKIGLIAEFRHIEKISLGM
jgi:UDP-glucose 4-epimerase